MAKYKYVNVLYEGHPMHYGVIRLSEVRKMKHPERLGALLEERHPDKIIALDVLDDDVLVALPTDETKNKIAREFLACVDAHRLSGWQEGEIES